MTAPIPMTSAEAYRAAIAPQKDVAAPPAERERPVGETDWHKAINHVDVDPNVQMLAERAEAARQWMAVGREAKSSLPGFPGGFSPAPGTQPRVTDEQQAVLHEQHARLFGPGTQPPLTDEQRADLRAFRRLIQ